MTSHSNRQHSTQPLNVGDRRGGNQRPVFFAAAHTKFATFNAKGLTTEVPLRDHSFEDKHVQICRFLYRNSIKVIGLQETHIKEDHTLE